MKVTFCKTKAGNGFKIAIDDTWLYVSKEYLHAVIDGEATSCQFKTMENSDSTKNESEDSEDWVLKQGLWPADTVGQARRFYEQMDISALKHLKEAGWEIGLNLHFSFGGTQLVHHHSDINPEVYFNLWAKHQIRLGQYSTEPDEFNQLMDDLVRNGLIEIEQVKLLEDKFLHTRRQHINVIPGFAFIKTMKSKRVLTLDTDNQLEDQILQEFETALNSWGETIYIQDNKK